MCRQLNYSGVARIAPRGEFGEGGGSIWLDQVHCQGSEESLDQCSHAGVGVVGCNHGDDVGVVCGKCVEF